MGFPLFILMGIYILIITDNHIDFLNILYINIRKSLINILEPSYITNCVSSI
jgi:hypothetical protein